MITVARLAVELNQFPPTALVKVSCDAIWLSAKLEDEFNDRGLLGRVDCPPWTAAPKRTELGQFQACIVKPVGHPGVRVKYEIGQRLWFLDDYNRPVSAVVTSIETETTKNHIEVTYRLTGRPTYRGKRCTEHYVVSERKLYPRT